LGGWPEGNKVLSVKERVRERERENEQINRHYIGEKNKNIQLQLEIPGKVNKFSNMKE